MNLLPEEEHKKLWCPWVRYILGPEDLAPKNREFHEDIHVEERDNPAEARCIGSRCGMWEWYDPEEEVKHSKINPSVETKEWTCWNPKAANPFFRMWVRPTKNRRGYCGVKR